MKVPAPSIYYHRFITALEDRWNVEDEGEISDRLNVEISSEDGAVVLRQSGYIERLLEIHAPDGVPKQFKSTD